jgi:hypothetical protein
MAKSQYYQNPNSLLAAYPFSFGQFRMFALIVVVTLSVKERLELGGYI